MTGRAAGAALGIQSKEMRVWEHQECVWSLAAHCRALKRMGNIDKRGHFWGLFFDGTTLGHPGKDTFIYFALIAGANIGFAMLNLVPA